MDLHFTLINCAKNFQQILAKETSLLINTVALAPCREMLKSVSRFNGFQIGLFSPKAVKTAEEIYSIRTHQAKATVLMKVMASVMLLTGPLFAQSKLPYENNFEKSEVGKVPDDMLVLDGQFTVKEETGNKVLELPGDPLDSFGVLFGPTENSNIVVTAKILGTGKGRRFPTFGVGAKGVNGYRLQVSPGKKSVELYKRDEVVKTVAFDFKSGEWTQLKLQISFVKEGEMKVEGKVWLKGAEEPKEPLVAYTDSAPGSAGRASIWGSPFSGTPIQFDDLSVTRSEAR